MFPPLLVLMVLLLAWSPVHADPPSTLPREVRQLADSLVAACRAKDIPRAASFCLARISEHDWQPRLPAADVLSRFGDYVRLHQPWTLTFVLHATPALSGTKREKWNILWETLPAQAHKLDVWFEHQPDGTWKVERADWF